MTPARGQVPGILVKERFITLSGSTPSATSLDTPIDIYNNTFIALNDYSKDSAGIIAFENDRSYTSVTAENNILHTPYQPAGVVTVSGLNSANAGWDHLSKGYQDSGAPDRFYQAYGNVVTAPTVGATVTGASSGVQGVITDIRNIVGYTSDLDGNHLLFTSLTGAGEFTAGEDLTDSDGGEYEAYNDKKSTTFGTIKLGITARIPNTAHPTRVIDFDAQTGSFTEGETLTGGTSAASAEILQVHDDGTTGRLWLGPVTDGPFEDNETITDGDTGSATANGADRYSGVISAWVPASAVTADGTTFDNLPRDFLLNERTTNQRGAVIA